MGELLERLRALKSGLNAPLEEEEAEDPLAFQQAVKEEPVAEQSLDERLAEAFRDIVAEPFDSSWESEDAQTGSEWLEHVVNLEAHAAPQPFVPSQSVDFVASRSGPRPFAAAATFRPAPKAASESRLRPQLGGPVDLTGAGRGHASGIAQPAARGSAPVPPKAKLGGAPSLANAAVPRATRAPRAFAEKSASSSQHGQAGGAYEQAASTSAPRAPTTPPKRGSLGGPSKVVPKERQSAPKAKPGGVSAIKLVAKAKARSQAQSAPAAQAARAAEAAVDVEALPDTVPEVVEVDAPQGVEAAAEVEADDPEVEAEKRLDRNKIAKEGWEVIRKIKEEFQLSSQVELGLKLLEPFKLWTVLGKNGNALRDRLKALANKDKAARAVVALSDPTADNLVRRLEQKEESAAVEEITVVVEDEENTAVAEGRLAAAQADELADLLAKEAAAPMPQPKAFARSGPRMAAENRPASRMQQAVRSRSPRGRVHDVEAGLHDDRANGRSDAWDRRQQGRSRSRSNGGRRHEDASRHVRERERPRGPTGHPANGSSEASTTDELGQWLASIDMSGVLRRYSEALHREFSNLAQLTAAFTPPPSGSNKPNLACIEPSVFQALGVQSLGHKLLIAKGIAALAGHKARGQ